jgi:hypothetical protein
MPQEPTIRNTYLGVADSVAGLLQDPAVATAWQEPSALQDLSVGGLAAHLAAQIFHVPALLAGTGLAQKPISLVDHYARAKWIESGVDEEPNVKIRRSGEEAAAEGAKALGSRAESTVSELRITLAAEPAGRVVHLPWGPWSLLLDDFLITRMMELAVHSDDLAVSVGVKTRLWRPRRRRP